MSFRFFLFGAAVLSLTSATAPCQQDQQEKTSGVSIVQPGAPGHSNKTLTPETATAAPRKPSEADIKFMQGMIMHHSQAVEMTELLKYAEPGQRGSGAGQTHQHLADRRDAIHEAVADRARRGSPRLAPWTWREWIWPEWITWICHADDARHADAGADEGLGGSHRTGFDHLFLTGMIQHHTGALTMVKDLFNDAGSRPGPPVI